MDSFVDLGAGWFLFDECEGRRELIVCDAMSSNPDHNFGPAAWSRKTGPLSGRTLLEAHAVLRGDWQQTGEEEWTWISDDGKEFSEEPPSWPRIIVVKNEDSRQILGDIAGKVVADNNELVELLRGITKDLPQLKLPWATAPVRMVAAKFRHPHIFGDLDSPSMSNVSN